ncbi:MAG: hypothetical protein AAF481_04910 [Acidobacteriota bacterium]
MAVFERTMRPFEGPFTPRRWRFLILARYAWRSIFSSRLLTGFFALCFGPVVAALIFAFLRNNPTALQTFQIALGDMPALDDTFFFYFMRVQGILAVILAAFVGPGLIAPDLAHGALPLYLARPFSRGDYVLGKATTLLVLLSSVTWLAAGLVWLLNGIMDPGPFTAGQLKTGFAIAFGGIVWVVVIALVSMAFSAWLRWKIPAGAAIFATFFVSDAMAAITNEIFKTQWASLLSLRWSIVRAWEALFFSTPRADGDLPAITAWLALAAISALCLWVIHRKLRAYEVVS